MAIFSAVELMAKEFEPETNRCQHVFSFGEMCFGRAVDSEYCGTHNRMWDLNALKYVFRIDHDEAVKRLRAFNVRDAQ